MTILSTLSHLFDGYRRAARDARTRRALSGLSVELQKDIGWRQAEPFRASSQAHHA